MSSIKNKIQLIGHLGSNPQVVVLESGRKMVKINLATTETYRNEKDEKVVDTQWHSLVCWGKTAELAETYLQKGSEIAIEGRLNNRAYTDKNGVKKYMTEIEVYDILILKYGT